MQQPEVHPRRCEQGTACGVLAGQERGKQQAGASSRAGKQQRMQHPEVHTRSRVQAYALLQE
jgi:hypothetical protein